jgi:hypothetical protein
MTLDKDFKTAIANLPSSEKNKLLFRLLKKEPLLCNQLYFKLINTKSVDELRDEFETTLLYNLKQTVLRFYSPGYLMMDLRFTSGDITEHVKTTKDKFGDAYLNLLLLNTALDGLNETLQSYTPSKTKKLYVYLLSKAFKILLLIDSLHEDYRIDFNADLRILGEYFSSNNQIMKAALYHGFDIEWLLLSDIPENIKEIHLDLRARGFLK